MKRKSKSLYKIRKASFCRVWAGSEFPPPTLHTFKNTQWWIYCKEAYLLLARVLKVARRKYCTIIHHSIYFQEREADFLTGRIFGEMHLLPWKWSQTNSNGIYHTISQYSKEEHICKKNDATVGWTEIKISLLINCGILGADADICRRLLVPKNWGPCFIKFWAQWPLRPVYKVKNQSS